MKIDTSSNMLTAAMNTLKAKNKGVDTYDEYKRKNGLLDPYGFSSAIGALYASSKRDLSSYGINNRNISNKGLQNSGYASYIDSLSKTKLDTGLNAIRDEYSNKEYDASLGYLGYLESYRDKTNTLKKSVMSHLVSNDVVDLNTAIAYGVSAGLSREEAEEIGRSAYDVTKQKVFNSILQQTVSLGLDKEGARQLAIKMGVSEADALDFANEIGELLDYYGNISDEYLEFLEQRANQ